MRQMTRAELIAARFALRRADMQLAQAKSVFITASYEQVVRVLNRVIGEIADMIAPLDKAIAAKGKP